MRLSRSKLHIKFFELEFSVDILKGLKKFKARLNSLINERSFCEWGL